MATVDVKCVNEVCPQPVTAAVTLPEYAPGVIGFPPLRCIGCGHDLWLDGPVHLETGT